ncbi:hypothetical protein P170DRAFT_479201 [Aspergillus steynii IBT 23096]|uniref:Uncharacterized protein n=1 Tax=Aspergillus steynii IBT 23096 TaxID=1392250 RepID=A0A2I2G079_9EURO|nr:uncharacterized protein P170DRAFT_479201 [Aspergillus steynii IBT 23096]PLB46287.1 hypothetical protein P170DRAFT_479201 [Aspergillus steynii IBT 23096]
MSTTTTATTSTSTCHSKLYDIPIKDAACAIPISDPNSSLMRTCCGAASVLSYSACDYYCLAQGQSVGDLAECLIKGGSDPGDFWCNTSANATTTATGNVPTGTGVGTVVVSATATGTGTGSGTAGGASATSSSGSTSGGDGVRVGKKAMGVVMMVVVGSMVGVVG